MPLLKTLKSWRYTIISGKGILFSLGKHIPDFDVQHPQVILFSFPVKLLTDPLAYGEYIR